MDGWFIKWVMDRLDFTYISKGSSQIDALFFDSSIQFKIYPELFVWHP